MTIRFIVRVVLAVVPVVLLAVWVWQDVAPSGTLTVVGTLGQYQPSISKFYPEGRLTAPERMSDGWTAEVLAEPIYVDVRLPRHLEHATVRLWYRTNGTVDLKLGLRVGGSGVWRYDLKPLVFHGDSDGWQVGEASFDMSQATVEHQRIRLMLSLPGLSAPGARLSLHRISVELSGTPLTVTAFVHGAFRYVARLLLMI